MDDDTGALLQVWDSARQRFDRDDVLRRQHKEWLRLTSPLGIMADTVLLAAPNDYVREYLDNHLRPYLAVVLGELLGRDVQVAVTVTVQSSDDGPDAPAPADGGAGRYGDDFDTGPGDTFARTADDQDWARRPDGFAGIDPAGLNGVDHRGPGLQPAPGTNGAVRPGPAGPPAPDYPQAPAAHTPFGADPADDRLGGSAVTGHPGGSGPGRASNERDAREARLNPKYTFDTFVIGSSNRFTHAAAVAVAEAPARAYNPLFIYGDSGLGKTHLLHAIGHYAQRLLPGLRTRYVSSEEFTNDFINSVRDDKMQAFQARYRSVDLLLIDDIQFLERAERTQEEFFHTFNTLHNANKQIVISSDKSPRQLNSLEDRLRTRFEWGLISDVQAPDLETRIAILRKKAAQEGMNLPPEVLEFIASRVQSNIRELEGALIRVTAFASLNRHTVDMALAENVLKDLVGEMDAPEITSATIMAVVAEFYGVSVDDLVGQSRSRALVQARQMAMYLCRELTELSLPRIGEKFGGRDHTTVMHAERKIKQLMKEKLTVYNQITELTTRIRLRSRG